MRDRYLISKTTFVCLLAATAALAQNNNGRISGTATDTSGSVVPGARITVSNVETGLKWNAVTDNGGFYQVANLPVGNFNVEVESTGFRKAEKTGFDLPDAGRITADFKLDVGTLTEAVQVTAVRGETVNTVSGEVARVIDSEQVQDLALNGRNYMQLVSLVPGVTVTSLDQMATTTSLSVSNQSVNGNRTDSNHLMVDGGMNLDSGSNGSQINNVGVDFIQEVRIQTSAFSAQYGRNSGASINVVTKSGGNHFHGSLFETFRNDYLDARDYFAPVKPELRFNDFGWSFGGPIAAGPLKKGKLFFFGGQEWKRIRRFTNPSRQTLPTLAEIQGDFSDRPTATINFPGTKNPIPNKNLTSLMTPDSRAIMNVYAAMIKYAATYSNTPTTNNAIFQVLNPFNFREDIARIDWQAAEKHSVYFRWIHDNYDTLDPFGSFTASALPTTPTKRNRPGYGPQFGYTWAITPALLQEVKLNASWNGQRTPLEGDAWQRSTYGFQFPRTFGGNGPYSSGIPDVTVNSFASFNGPARVYLSSPTTDITLSDNLTWVHDTHLLKTGVMIIRNRKDQNGRSVYDGSAVFNTNAPNTNTTGYALADAAIGQFQTYTEAGSDPIGFFRFTQYEGYVEDSWRVLQNLSIVVGVRFSHYIPIYTQANNMANFVPALYDPAKAVTITPGGLIVPGSGNQFNGLVRAGDGVPASEVGRVPGATSPATLAIPAGVPRGFFDARNFLMPRFSFAWTPFGGKTVVRSGFGTFHDRTQGNLIFSQTLLPPYSYQVQYQSGNLSSPSGGNISAPAPQGTIRALDPNLKNQVVYTYNFGIQRELPAGFFIDLGYVGNQTRHGYRGPNINEPSLDALVANQAIPSASRPSNNSIVSYKGFSTINQILSDANANYNSLQAYMTKRKGNTLLTVSYTWSKALDEADAYNDAGDPIIWQDRHYNYGPAGFDRRHVFVATYTYRIPFLRHSHGLAGHTLGGWEVSGITRMQSGPLLSAVGSSSIPGTRRSQYLGGPVELASDVRSADHWFNTAAFANAPATALGNAGPGTIEGPSWNNWDVSLRKVFPIREGWNLRFQADAFNVANHTNFNAPNVTTSSTNFGTITGSQPARQIQLGARLVF